MCIKANDQQIDLFFSAFGKGFVIKTVGYTCSSFLLNVYKCSFSAKVVNSVCMPVPSFAEVWWKVALILFAYAVASFIVTSSFSVSSTLEAANAIIMGPDDNYYNSSTQYCRFSKDYWDVEEYTKHTAAAPL